ncbi:MAG: hypothetical protein K8S62_07985 [Candidatus Sabulitectum sp.]|nr:hypothetical protein [Candidatus Sabulitectum sp.]
MNLDHIKVFFLATLILLVTSCGSDTGESTIGSENSIPEYQLALIDSFGVEMGDSINMIGSIGDFCYSTDGSILILDNTSLKVRVIPYDGDAKIICNRGEGPGEFLYPLALCAFDNNNFLVSDEMKQEVMEFNSSGEYIGSFLSTSGYVPYSMFSVNSNTIVSDQLVFDMESEIPQYIYYVGGFHPSVADPLQVYCEMSWDWTSADFYRDIDLLDFTAGSSERVYIASDVTDYRISVLYLDGLEIGEIIGSVDRIRKTPEQIELEIEEFEEWAKQDQAYMGGYQPPEYKDLISLAGIDPEGNLWIQRYGSEISFNFDVWDESNNLIFNVSFPRNVEMPDLEFHIDDHGILGANTDSEEYPRIYSFVLDEEAIVRN